MLCAQRSERRRMRREGRLDAIGGKAARLGNDHAEGGGEGVRYAAPQSSRC